MCLYTKQICPLRARKDIVCYKRFKITPPYVMKWFYNSTNGSNIMTTEVRNMIVRTPKPGEPTVMVAYPDCIEKVRTIDITRDRDNARFRIYGGMIHAFTNLGICNKGSSPIVVYKCIIPKGTIYYKGTNDDICAKKMLVIERVK